MVAPGFLANPEVRRWLNGVEPARTTLDFDSFNALHDEPSASNPAIRLEANLTEWPGYDKDELVRYHKFINEPDFLPLHFIRILTQTAKLFRTHHGKLVPRPLGRKMLAAEHHGPLQALLCHIALWHMNLAYFDRYPLDSWPQTQVGVVLWSLSASAHGWLPRETLTRLCTIPVNGVLEARWDFGSGALEARILRPLVWFGLLESRGEQRSATEFVERRLYRKAPLFDRFVKFNIRIEGPDTRH